MRTVWWDNGAVAMIDQRRLPRQEVVLHCRSVSDVVAAIRGMAVRGAPAIGVTAAFGMALAAHASSATEAAGLLADMQAAKAELDAARPTAVNLAWATERMLSAARDDRSDDPDTLREHLLTQAQLIHDEDEAMCRAIGDHGAALLRDGARVLTHCNAGGLATAGYGTALAPIKTAHRLGRRLHVLVDETRPFLQGARLTSWELLQEGIDQTLITDSMAGYFMRRGEVDCVIVGADRIVANGDVANKIGTYSLAVLAHAHGIPLYVAAPSSTVDLEPAGRRCDPDRAARLGRGNAPARAAARARRRDGRAPCLRRNSARADCRHHHRTRHRAPAVPGKVGTTLLGTAGAPFSNEQ